MVDVLSSRLFDKWHLGHADHNGVKNASMNLNF